MNFTFPLSDFDDHTLMHSKFCGSRTISDFHGVVPLDFSMNHSKISGINPKGAPHENQKLEIVLEPLNSLCIKFRPVGRGVAGMARATPTFGRSKSKSTVGHPNFWRKEALNWPSQL